MKNEDLIKIIREEIEDALKERSLSDKEEKKKEKFVKSLKKNAKDFKDRYGEDWKSVMYAVATKNAKTKKGKKDGN